MDNPCREEMMLSAFMDGELSVAQTQQVRRHLKSCEACQRQLVDLQATDGLIKNLGPLEPSKGFERRFWDKVADLEVSRQTRWWERYSRPAWRPALAAGLVCCVIAGVLTFGGIGVSVSPEDRFMAENVEFLTDFDVIHNLDILENWDEIEAMKELS